MIMFLSWVHAMSNSYKDLVIPFGTTHKGELIADCPNSYLEWLMEQEWFELKFSEHYEMTKKELAYRKNFDIHID